MSKNRLLIILGIIVIVPAGFLTKFYTGPAQSWVNNSCGGLLYEVFWCLVFALLFPTARPVKIALWVFLITCCLEFLQLWHSPFLEIIRINFIGRTILGNSFNWGDFPYYVLGSSAGYALLMIIKSLTKQTVR
jgi:hypothetical protein